MSFQLINPSTVHQPTGYSHAARVGDILHISGQVALAADGSIVGPGDPEAQARQAFANLRAILQDQGGDLKHIFKMTVLMTHPSYVGPFRAVRNQLFGEPLPASTLHVVQALAAPEWLVEVEAMALLE